MSCNCDHLEATHPEIVASQVLCGLDELNGKRVESHWREGYHPKAYSKHLTKKERDLLTAELCARIQSLPNTNSLSLELQMWWRDHQKADKKREAYKRSKWDYYGN